MPEIENKTPETPPETPPAAGGTPPETKPPETPPGAPETYAVTVDGKQVQMTLTELQAGAAKAAGADAKFREASELRKTAERGVRVQSLFADVSKSENPSQEDVSELAGLLGVDPSEFTEAVYGKEQQVPDPNTTPTTPVTPPTPFSVGTAQLAPDVQAQLKWAKEKQIEDAGKEIDKSIENYLDNDEVLGKIITDTDDEQRADMRSAIKEIVHESVRGKILATGQFGPEVVKEAGQQARATLKKFGIPTKMSKQLNTVVLGLGPSGQLPAEVQADEPIKRVDSAEDNYISNAVQRFQQNTLKFLRGKQK